MKHDVSRSPAGRHRSGARPAGGRSRRSRSRRISPSSIALALVFLIGLGLLLYPTVSNLWNSYHQSQAIVAYSEENAADFEFAPGTFRTAGSADVTVTYAGKTATFTVSVVSQPAEPEVVSVAVKSAPSKTAYKVGESLDPSGLVLTLTMSDGTTREAAYDAADFVFDTTRFNAAGEKTVTVTYKGEHTATFTVTVTADERPGRPGEGPSGPSAPEPGQQGPGDEPSGGLAATGDPTSFAAALAAAVSGVGAIAVSRRRR